MTRPSDWQVFFDDHAPAYEGNCFTKNTLAEAEFLVEELGLAEGMALLDVGCGTGRHAIELAKRGLCVTGVDLSPGMLAQARKHAEEAGVEVTLLNADAKSFTLDAPADAAVCLCEGAFGLLSGGDDPLGQPLAILRCIAEALKPEAPCLFTVLSAYRLARLHDQDAVTAGTFDPLTLSEVSECELPGGGKGTLRERAFMPTELVLLFALAGLEVTNIWGGTAGNWGHRPIDLDEFELMVKARKVATPAAEPPFPIYCAE